MGKRFLKLFKNVYILSVLLVLLPLSLLFIPIFFVILLHRSVVWGIAHLFRPDLDSFVTGSRADFATNSRSKIAETIICVIFVDGQLHLETLRRHMQKRVMNAKDPVTGELLYEGLRKSWEGFLGYAFWKKDLNFDLRNHVREYDYGGKLNLESPCTYKELTAVLGGLYEAPWNWDKGQSPWELLLLRDVMDEEGAPCSAIVLRTNHILADGYSLLELLRNLTQSPFSVPKPKLLKRGSTFLEKLNLIWRVPWDTADAILDMQDLKPLKWSPDPTNEPLIASVSPIIPVEEIKRLINHFGVSYGTVVYAAALGAIERVLRESAEVVPSRLGGNVVLPRAGHPHKGLVVHAVSGSVNWTLKANDPVERLKKIYMEQLALLKSTTLDAAPIVCELVAFLPISWRKLLAGGASTGIDFIVVSFPVTISQEFYNGHGIRSMFFGVGPLAPLGMVFVISGVHNKQICQVTVNPRLFKDPKAGQKLGTYFVEEIQALAREMDGNNKVKLL